MRQSRLVTATLILALLARGGALACSAPVGSDGKAHLETRRPVQGEDVRLTTGFGMRFHPLLNERRMHDGIDWSASMNAPVLAAARGRVTYAGRRGFYGNLVVIDHGGGLETAYGHLDSFLVHVGDCVEAGARIGAAGRSGLTSITGVHFEVRRDGQAVDPWAVPAGN
jgi:murein DD-endopeptidase MepM/ murein hydrolase activator NlpD